MAGIRSNAFEFPSEIQFKAIPEIVASEERDVLCQAKSGTGKTAVYILSLLNMIMPNSDGDFVPHSCIVVVSTRELAHQVFLAFRKLSSGFKRPPLRISCYFGGSSLIDCK